MLQRKAGNQVVVRLLAKRSLQPKLTAGAADDPYEQEAHRVAAQVVRTPSTPVQAMRIQPQDEETEAIQPKGGLEGSFSLD